MISILHVRRKPKDNFTVKKVGLFTFTLKQLINKIIIYILPSKLCFYGFAKLENGKKE
jgi:hypothetical protein